MKRTFKRLIACFLALVLVLPIGVSAMEDFGGDFSDDNENEVIGYLDNREARFGIYTKQINQIQEYLMKNGASTELTDYFERQCEIDAAAALKRYNGGTFFEGLNNFSNAFFSIAGKISALYTMANGIYSVLQQFGVVKGKSESATESILAATKHIEKSVQEINTKLNTLERKMDEMYAKLMMESKHQEYLMYQNAWNDFYRQVQSMDAEVTNFTNAVASEIIGYARGWQKSGVTDLRVLYGYDESGKLLVLCAENNMDEAGKILPVVPTTSRDGIKVAFSIKINGKLIYDNIDSTATITADNAIDIVKDAVSKSIAMSNVVQFISDGGKELGWDSMSDEERERFAYQLVDDAIDSITYAASTRTLNKNGGERYSAIYNEYKNFTDYIIGDKLTSPLTAQHKMLSLTHGFEGEILKDEQSIMAYLELLCNNYGMFMSMVADMSDLSTETIQGEVRVDWLRMLATLMGERGEFLTGNDNYCYITDTTIEYKDVTAESDMYVEALEAYDMDKKCVDRTYMLTYQNYSKEDWYLIDHTKEYPLDVSSEEYKKAVVDNSKEIVDNIMDASELLMLYSLYESQYSDIGSFRMYLRAYGAYVPSEASLDDTDNYGIGDSVITSFLPSDYNLGSGEFMTAYPVGIDKDAKNSDNFTFGRQYKINVGNGWKDQYFVFSDKVTGGVFNLDTGKVSENEMLVARALYGESHALWSRDEISFFTNANSVELDSIDLGEAPKEHTGSLHVVNETCHISKDLGVVVKTHDKSEFGYGGIYTVPASVKSISEHGLAGSGMWNISELILPDGLSSKLINTYAFRGLGTQNSRVLLRYSGVSSEMLNFVWKGGWFGDALINVDYSFGDEEEQFKFVAVSGADAKIIDCPIPEDQYPDGRTFAGWSTEKGKTVAPDELFLEDGMTIYAVWAYDHEHDVEFLHKDATCTEDGLDLKVYCKVCGLVMTEGEIIHAEGHNFDFLGGFSSGKYKCVNCGEEHQFESLIVGPYSLLIDVTESGNVYNAVSYDEDMLMIRTSATVVIKNKTAETATTPICISKYNNGNIVLAGVNISTDGGVFPAIFVEEGSTHGLNVILAAETSNKLISGGSGNAAIHGADPSVTIRIDGEGSLVAEGSSNGAGIGGNNVNIIIDGGKIVATGKGKAAGIGACGGYDAGNITINGGCVEATGGSTTLLLFFDYHAAGIGGAANGNPPESIVINGGEIVATSVHGAAIGAGYGTSVFKIKGGDIRINGGTIVAKTSGEGSAIGNSKDSTYAGIYISGGVVTATSPSRARVIDATQLYISNSASVKVQGRIVRAPLDWSGRKVELTIIENPTGEKLIVDGNEFPYTDHMGENRVYVYLPKVVSFESTPAPISNTVVFVWNYKGENSPFATDVEITYVASGDKVDAPMVNDTEEYIFDGWYADEKLTEKFDFDKEITDTIELYAKWIKKPASDSTILTTIIIASSALVVCGVGVAIVVVISAKKKKSK